jgi:uncharacterized membrane protein YpjA
MEYLGDGITGDEMNQNLFLIYHSIPVFHYSLAQTWHAMNNFIDYTLEVLRRHYNVLEKSRQGRPLFQNSIGTKRVYK